MTAIIFRSLLDVMQEVPELLQRVCRCVGVKALRKVNKAASKIAIQEIRSFCLELCPDISAPRVPPLPNCTVTGEPLLEVAAFLEQTHLRRFSLEILVTRGQ